MSASLFAIAPTDEIVVDHTSAKGAEVRTIRGTLLAMAILRLREMGYYERYLAELPVEHRDAVLYALPMSWVSVELILVHCRACDRLELPDEVLLELGGQTAKNVMQTIFQKFFHGTGITPWVAMNSIGRLWDRLHEGGAVTVIRRGPKDAYIEQRGHPVASSRYYTGTAQGFYISVAEMFANKAYVRRVRPRVAAPDTFAFVVSWV